MDSLLTPIDLTKYGLQRTGSVKESIDAFLNLLLSTTCGESPIDPQFGFIFNNMRFEIFNEREGVVYNSQPSEEVEENDLYSKKISGNSKNFNTFATDLRAAIMKYEPRLENVAATMSYIREERKVYVTVTGNITETKEKYQYETILNIWN